MAALLFPLCAQAQTQAPAPLKDYPRQAITLISPFPPGGGNDGVARLLANELGRITASLVVENQSGAGGSAVGTAAVAPRQGRRLYPGAVAEQRDGGEPRHLQEHRLRRAEGLHPRIADHLGPARARRAQGKPLPHAGRLPERRPGPARRRHLRHARQRHAVAPDRRAAGAAERPVARARAVPGRRPCRQRPAPGRGGHADHLASLGHPWSPAASCACWASPTNRIGAFERAPTLAGQGIADVSIEAGTACSPPPAHRPNAWRTWPPRSARRRARQPCSTKIRRDGAEVVASRPPRSPASCKTKRPTGPASSRRRKLAVD